MSKCNVIGNGHTGGDDCFCLSDTPKTILVFKKQHYSEDEMWKYLEESFKTIERELNAANAKIAELEEAIKSQRDRVIEECARVAEEMPSEMSDGPTKGSKVTWRPDCDAAAEQIRSLKCGEASTESTHQPDMSKNPPAEYTPEYLRGFRDARDRAAKVAEDCNEGDSVSGQKGYYCQLGDAGLMRGTIVDRIKALSPDDSIKGGESDAMLAEREKEEGK